MNKFDDQEIDNSIDIRINILEATNNFLFNTFGKKVADFLVSRLAEAAKEILSKKLFSDYHIHLRVNLVTSALVLGVTLIKVSEVNELFPSDVSSKINAAYKASPKKSLLIISYEQGGEVFSRTTPFDQQILEDGLLWYETVFLAK